MQGAERFSEDLDFAGGVDFSAASMRRIQDCVEKRIGDRFGLKVGVSHQAARIGADGAPRVRVEKWWISIETAPENRAMPRQRIKLEIANVAARTRELLPLRSRYEFHAGKPTVLINAETLDEIMADKVLAFPTSLLDDHGQPVNAGSAKIRHRDIWGLAWMATRGAKLVPELVAAKIGDYGLAEYPKLLDQAIARIPVIVKSAAFKGQMARFVDSATVAKTLANDSYSDYLAGAVGELFSQMKAALATVPQPGAATSRHATPDSTKDLPNGPSKKKSPDH